MAYLSRPDGIDIHYEERGEGSAVFLAHAPVMSMPSVFEGLLADLARDHLVVTWDPRGVGRSTRRGPYDISTDTDDMAALVEEVGQSGVLVSTGLYPVPHMLGAKRPELTDAVVLAGGIPRFRPARAAQSEGMLGSESVVEAVMQLARTDHRSIVRAAIAGTNPQMSEAEIAERVDAQVAYCPWDVLLGRMEFFVADESFAQAGPALGSRLWIIDWAAVVEGGRLETVENAKKVLPDAHIVEAEDGPISRPDITADAIRQITVDDRTRATSEPG
jgi:pimeloyl-ACP methyl ester carboxylesterase